jgi:hypothetical protein
LRLKEKEAVFEKAAFFFIMAPPLERRGGPQGRGGRSSIQIQNLKSKIEMAPLLGKEGVARRAGMVDLQSKIQNLRSKMENSCSTRGTRVRTFQSLIFPTAYKPYNTHFPCSTMEQKVEQNGLFGFKTETAALLI